MVASNKVIIAGEVRGDGELKNIDNNKRRALACLIDLKLKKIQEVLDIEPSSKAFNELRISLFDRVGSSIKLLTSIVDETNAMVLSSSFISSMLSVSRAEAKTAFAYGLASGVNSIIKGPALLF